MLERSQTFRPYELVTIAMDFDGTIPKNKQKEALHDESALIGEPNLGTSAGYLG